MRNMEIYGIGTDIIEISRIEKAINQTSLFKRKVYTEKEIEHIEKKKASVCQLCREICCERGGFQGVWDWGAWVFAE